MAWRFKPSKYKNAAPITPKPEACVRDISVGSYQTFGNNITASAAFMAFVLDQSGFSLSVLPVDDCGRKTKLMPLIQGHSDVVTGMDFNPFHDGLLATASQDSFVKVWLIPQNGLEETISVPECQFYHHQRRVETLMFHPTADALLTSTSGPAVMLWDIMASKNLMNNSSHPDLIQAIDWKYDGSLLATSCKDKQVRIMDPRIVDTGLGYFTHAANSHQTVKDSRVVWLGDQPRILTTGFNASRQREIIIRDLRRFEEPEKVLTLDSSTGILIPLFDADTNMLFLAGKGDTSISYWEVMDREPFLVEGIRHNGEQTKGACFVPKRSLNVMLGEVNRILQLTSSSVIPISYQVPRKSYRDFHADLFPDTKGCEPQLTGIHWMSGIDLQVPLISLDPSKNQTGVTYTQPRLGPKPFAPPKFTGWGDIEKEQVAAAAEAAALDEKPSEHSMFELPEPSSSKTVELPRVHDVAFTGSPLESMGYLPDRKAANHDLTAQLKLQEAMEEGGTLPDGSRTPTTAERRKMFEPPPFIPEQEARPSFASLNYNPPTEEDMESLFVAPTVEDSSFVEEVSSTDSIRVDMEEEMSDEFERESLLRHSISERRRLYERSTSMQDEQKVQKDKSKNGGSPKPKPMQRQHSLEASKNGEGAGEASPPLNVTPVAKRTSTVFGRVSKFRHLEATPMHKSTHIENVRNVSRQVSSECDGFHGNASRVAVPLEGAGGKICVFELNKPGKLLDGVLPTIVHGTNVMDFMWDPFDDRRLAVGGDDGIIRIWEVPTGGLTQSVTTPALELSNGHAEKIYCLKFHPLACDVLASASYDMTVRIWDLATGRDEVILEGHTVQIFGIAWSPDGTSLATFSRDGKTRVYEPRRSTHAVRIGKGPVGQRGGRIVWALGGACIIVLGFDKASERQIMMFHALNLTTPLNVIGLDVAPAILIPYYDEDSSTLFVTGKGDRTIYAFEVTEESPYLCPLSHYRSKSPHQGLSFLPKNVCDVVAVEFARALRLIKNVIEPFSFTVPRVKAGLFQDDLFPPTKVTWEHSLTSAEWFSGKNAQPQYISLQPAGMLCLSAFQGPSTSVDKAPSKGGIGAVQEQLSRLSFGPELAADAKEKEEQLRQSVSNRMEVNLQLEQDDMEGVDEEEWDE